MMNYNLSKTK